MAALYLTIWASVLLFVIAEAGRVRSGSAPWWAWWAFAAGLALAIVHTLLAFAVVHEWSHTDAVRATATQTAAVYGVLFGGGVYVNYAFLGVWIADAWWWRVIPPQERPHRVTWTLRIFYLIIIFNAAVVFAAGMRRIAGVVVTAVLIWLWTRRGISPEQVRC